MMGELKPNEVVLETEFDVAVRAARRRIVENALVSVEAPRARFTDAKDMLGFFFKMHDHMASAPGIDYARDVVQGSPVDRDERIHWVARVKGLLEQLARQQENGEGVLLLYLHLRAANGIAIRDLHEHRGNRFRVPPGRNQTIREFWEALQAVEDMALTKGWVQHRVERASRSTAVQVYRRPT